jgi:hypothetical protein
MLRRQHEPRVVIHGDEVTARLTGGRVLVGQALRLIGLTFSSQCIVSPELSLLLH